MQAGLYGLTTLTGGHFGYALKAGARIEDSAVIHNESDEARTFHVYGADVSNAAGGGLAPAQEGQRMRAVGAWLKLDSEATVTVRPKSSATVRFSLAVPDGTPPGSYLGSLVTALRTPAVSGQVNTETRIARLVQLTVPGTADLQVSLTELEHRPAGGDEEFTVTVRNTGNVLYTFAGTLNVTGGGSTRTVPLTPTGIYVIPGGSATITGRLAGLPALGRRAVTASVTATVPGGAAKTVESNTVRLSCFPWLVAALTAGGLPALGRRAVTASVTATVPGGAAKTVESNTVRLSCFPWLVAALTAGGLLALGLVLIVTRKRWRAWLRRRAEERTALRALKRELRATRCRPGRGSAGARSLR
ncbi:hypothetical protein J0X20_27715 [Streptomyces sp. KCTC 0041BP]|uniref:COG1470 family protein n=1 Tax=Streptomyces sp. KCTC 0041BP TaxID=201500 RepID=UPI001AE1940D|nr:hypothetical protein [Streptomyces sp. KCTC 0041BP]MBP0937379.1 hypothetical protein [Streptomyces sp. KCTC 0041BP]